MRFKFLLLTPLILVVLIAPTTIVSAGQSVNLGSTSNFAVLAGTTITNAGTTTINGKDSGKVGLFPGTSFTGQESTSVNGDVKLADADALLAKNDLVMAYNDADNRKSINRIPTELGGTTLTPGTYDSADGTFEITGTLTLDAQGDPNAVFIFKTASTLITASGSSVNLAHNARSSQITWKVGSSATLGTSSHFAGSILALTSITANTDATVQGQLMARNGAVTLDSNTITNTTDTIKQDTKTIRKNMENKKRVDLGTTSKFAVLAGTTITNTGKTSIDGIANGKVGLFPGTAFTGQESTSISGDVQLADAEALAAKNDLVAAYNDADERTSVTRIPTQLGGTTLTPGTYDSADGTFQITGTLTLDAQGDPNAVFIFKTASTLITASGSNVNLLNNARFCQTIWNVGSSATLGTNSHIVGHVLALTSITSNTGATVLGQLLARNGAVTLDTNTITNGVNSTTPIPAILNVDTDGGDQARSN